MASMTRPFVLRTLALAVMALAVAGCSHLHWPWHRAPPPAPVPVHEVDIQGSAASFPQYWKRNTLVIDLSGAAGSGAVTVKPVAGTTWPVRIAFRVRAGSFQVLEVRGAQRVTLPVAPGGAAVADLELPPGAYLLKTPELAVSWGPAAVPLQ